MNSCIKIAIFVHTPVCDDADIQLTKDEGSGKIFHHTSSNLRVCVCVCAIDTCIISAS